MSIISPMRVATVLGIVSLCALAPSAYGSSSLSFLSNVFNKTINQGDEIYIYTLSGSSNVACTLGYVTNDYALTAGHCGFENSIVKNNNGKKIGHIDYIDYNGAQDIAIIKLDDDVISGSNTYSGDYITSMAEMSPSDKLCHYGKTTKQVICAEQHRLPTYGLFWSKGNGELGDSGGPVWVEGKGLIGIISTKGNDYTTSTEAWITINKYPDFTAPRASSTTGFIPLDN